jgi:hypothetical protein
MPKTCATADLHMEMAVSFLQRCPAATVKEGMMIAGFSKEEIEDRAKQAWIYHHHKKRDANTIRVVTNTPSNVLQLCKCEREGERWVVGQRSVQTDQGSNLGQSLSKNNSENSEEWIYWPIPVEAWSKRDDGQTPFQKSLRSGRQLRCCQSEQWQLE